MDFRDLAAEHAFVVEHLEGWALVRVRRDLDDATWEAVIAAARAQDASHVVLDLGRHAGVDRADLDAVAALATEKASAGKLSVVSGSDDVRTALRELGVTEVHESLDAALAVTAPIIVFQQDRGPARLPPAAGDVTTVAATDLLGPGPARA